MKCFGRTGICQRFGRFMAYPHRPHKQSIVAWRPFTEPTPEPRLKPESLVKSLSHCGS
jgi:hypothetical protein